MLSDCLAIRIVRTFAIIFILENCIALRWTGREVAVIGLAVNLVWRGETIIYRYARLVQFFLTNLHLRGLVDITRPCR